jgi:hypothetical protein
MVSVFPALLNMKSLKFSPFETLTIHYKKKKKTAVKVKIINHPSKIPEVLGRKIQCRLW